MNRKKRITIFISAPMLFVLSLVFIVAGDCQSAAPSGSGPQNMITRQPDGASSRADVPDSSTMSAETAGRFPEKSTVKSTSTLDIFLNKWLHLQDKHPSLHIKNHSVIAFAPHVPGDLARIFKLGSRQSAAAGVLEILLRSSASIGCGFLVVFFFRRTARKSIARFEQISPPDDRSLSRLWTGMVRNISGLTSLILLAVSSSLAFPFFAGDATLEARMFYQFLLSSVLIVVSCTIISRIIFAPYDAAVRPLNLPDTLAKSFHYAFTAASTLLLSGMVFVYLLAELGAMAQTVAWISIILGSLVTAVFAYLVVYLRKPFLTLQQANKDSSKTSWFAAQLKEYWHVPALVYLAVVWFVWIGQEFAGAAVRNGWFIISLLIIPMYFILSHAGYVIVISVVDSLRLGEQQPFDTVSEAEKKATSQKLLARKTSIVATSHKVYRILLGAALATWLLSLWGVEIPFAAHAVKAIFESLATLALAILFWRSASSYIQRKIEESTSDQAAEDADSDDEFGGAIVRGRSYTLLPMLRKVMGTTLVIMVILIVLSSLGLNIAPLLAGAGVVGIAVGFGARKLVSDVISGFFFLLDDAFRVGEYIQTGEIRGTVESITLRNVMLRHHLGMLQIVPHSDLGAVTNYMRGGIVIKFPLEFPYDTDIEKVRKIIKKVGQSMLEDEELGDDFVHPVKSQGVYEITNSVMVIRVKFTAKPGKQFVIKREAFRRITEALNARGIYYAHRKVIVDFPKDDHQDTMDKETGMLAAAGSELAVAEEQKQAEEKTGRPAD
ncbi:MAG: mechanosensitive ion channel family protein [Desulforhopalus sp.]